MAMSELEYRSDELIVHRFVVTLWFVGQTKGVESCHIWISK